MTKECTFEQFVSSTPGMAETIAFANAQMKTASWVIRNKATGEVIMETFDARVVAALNTAKHEAIPILAYLQSLNSR